MKNHLSLYLDRYAEEKATLIYRALFNDDSLTELQFSHCIVIPAYNENSNILQQFKEIPFSHDAILIIVNINQPDDIPSTEKNQVLWHDIKNTNKLITEKNNCLLSKIHNKNTYILSVDCFTQGQKLPRKQGVGLARKIACDIACSLIQNNMLTSQWIHNTDADTQLPETYLSQTPDHSQFSAAIYPFKHHLLNTESTLSTSAENKRIDEATQLYEQTLLFYVEGLAYANSAYSYQTIGSCMLINVTSYAKVRGFPKRAGGEDFYCLNKLRKIAPIKTLNGEAISIASRLSDRAPFGTGPSVKKIIEQELRPETYLYYNPKVFKELKKVLLHLHSLYDLKNEKSIEKLLNGLPLFSREALLTLGIKGFVEHLQIQCEHKDQFVKQTQDWFDAFKTLKFIHLLRNHFPDIPIESAVKELKKMQLTL